MGWMTSGIRTIRGWVAAAGVFCFCACGSGSASDSGGGPLDCAWSASNNCWKQLLSAAEACMPAASSGTTSSDGTTCAYPDGTLVRFEPAVTSWSPGAVQELWLEKEPGVTCLRFRSVPSSNSGRTDMEFQVGDATLTLVTTSATGTKITCPDGVSYSSEDIGKLLSCPEGIPGFSEGGSSTGSIHVGFSQTVDITCN